MDDNEKFEDAQVEVLRDTTEKAGVDFSVINYRIDTVPIPLWTVDLAGYEKHLGLIKEKGFRVKPLKRLSLLAVALNGMDADSNWEKRF